MSKALQPWRRTSSGFGPDHYRATWSVVSGACGVIHALGSADVFDGLRLVAWCDTRIERDTKLVRFPCDSNGSAVHGCECKFSRVAFRYSTGDEFAFHSHPFGASFEPDP